MPFHWSGAVHWSSTATQTLSAAALSALLMTSAMKHFRDPGFYRQVVPDYLCRDEPDPQPRRQRQRGRTARGRSP